MRPDLRAVVCRSVRASAGLASAALSRKGNDVTPHDRRLLLLTQPQMLDATEEHIFDILVGYWHAEKMVFVAADSPAAPANGRTVRVFKWAELPDHSDITLIEHAESFEVRSDDGATVRQFPFDTSASRRTISGMSTKKRALQEARTFAGKAAVLVQRSS